MTRVRLVLRINDNESRVWYCENGTRHAEIIPHGGTHWIRALNTRLRVSPSRARYIKNRFGFDQSAADGLVAAVLQDLLNDFIDSLHRTLRPLCARTRISSDIPLEITGSHAQTPGLRTALRQALNRPVILQLSQPNENPELLETLFQSPTAT